MTQDTPGVYSPVAQFFGDDDIEEPVFKLNNVNLPILARHPKLRTPRYNRNKLTAGIVHFGLGNFHRSHQCVFFDALLHLPGNEHWGEIAIGMRRATDPKVESSDEQDGLFCVTEKPETKRPRTRVIGNLIKYISGNIDPQAALDVLFNKDVHIVTLTITEGGYFIDPLTSRLDLSNEEIKEDLENDLAEPKTVFGMIVAAIRERRSRGIAPFSILSCDNIPHNGNLTEKVVTDFARALDKKLADWIKENIAFPNSMVDRITPSANGNDKEYLELVYELDDEWPVVCEPYLQWVIEDKFSGPRPPLEQVGVEIVSNVAPYETAKLRILNASHIALGCIGGLKGARFSYETIRFSDVEKFMRNYMFLEALPTLEPIPGVNLEQYCEIVLSRFDNSKIGDTTSRLLTNTSDRISKFLLPVIYDRIRRHEPSPYAAFICAAWAQCFVKTTSLGEGHIFYEGRYLELSTAANSADLSKFLTLSGVFGNLYTHKEFVDEFVLARKTIGHLGIDEALIKYIQ